MKSSFYSMNNNNKLILYPGFKNSTTQPKQNIGTYDKDEYVVISKTDAKLNDIANYLLIITTICGFIGWLSSRR